MVAALCQSVIMLTVGPVLASMPVENIVSVVWSLAAIRNKHALEEARSLMQQAAPLLVEKLKEVRM